MSVETYRVLMGACGWKHKAWLNDFYSEDLPEEWQLGFYSNEFPVVYIRATDWLKLADLEEWREDVSDSFRFILEISEDVISDQQRFVTALKQAESLAEFCLGLVLQVSPDSTSDIQLFEKNLKMAQVIAPTCVDKCGSALSLEFDDILRKQNISEVWHGDSQEINNLKRGALAISCISGDGLDMTGLRKIIETCLAASDENCTSVLCLDGDPPSLELLRNANIILDLL